MAKESIGKRSGGTGGGGQIYSVLISRLVNKGMHMHNQRSKRDGKNLRKKTHRNVKTSDLVISVFYKHRRAHVFNFILKTWVLAYALLEGLWP